MCRRHRAASLVFRLIAIVILGQTLFFKFTAAPESVYIFTTLGMEPWGRILTGVAELVACVLLAIPRTAAVGAIMTLGIISGAIGGHLTKLGIVVQDDGGLLFGLALTVFASAAIVLLLERGTLPFIGHRLVRQDCALPPKEPS